MHQHTGLLRVTHELLIDRLGLPTDMRILAVVQKPEDLLDGTFQLVVEHSDLPDRLEGAAPRVMTIESLAKSK